MGIINLFMEDKKGELDMRTVIMGLKPECNDVFEFDYNINDARPLLKFENCKLKNFSLALYKNTYLYIIGGKMKGHGPHYASKENFRI